MWAKLSTYTLNHRHFDYQKTQKVPVVMVGPGTGVAPIRAFLQERQHLKHVKNVEIGRTCLFFGCRRSDEDFIYESEMLQYTQDGTLTDFYSVFSRKYFEESVCTKFDD